MQPRANGQAQRILEEARAYKARTVLEAQGEVARFAKILPEYKAAPEITKERLYIETMERVLSHTRKVLVSNSNNNLMVLPLDQLMRGQGSSSSTRSSQESSSLMRLPSTSVSNDRASSGSSFSPDDIMDQRRANALRNDTQREGRE